MKKYDKRNVAMKKMNNTDYIKVSNHAIEQFKLRSKKDWLTNDDIIKSIVNQVKQSNIIKINGNEEHRMHKQFMYVVKKDFEKDLLGMIKTTMTVVTVKLTTEGKKELFSKDFSLETVDLEAMDANKFNKKAI